MDQDKIGKLIAKLRKEKGMTQRELGDMVNVGFKAVSKWERGITCPDISIINELSKILGITSDELLTGELNPEQIQDNKSNKKFNKKILLIAALIIFVALIGFVIYKASSDKVDVYNLDSLSDEYYVEGKVVFRKNNIHIYINKLQFADKNFIETLVKNYTYRIDCGNKNLIIYGYLLDIDELSQLITIREIMEKINVYYGDIIGVNEKELIKNGLILKITFIDNNDNLIEKNIILTLNSVK